MKKQQKALERFPMPDQRQRARLASLARSRLEDVYQPIGIDHFAVKGDGLETAMRSMTLRRNFQGYTTDQAETLLAFGPSSISKLPQGFVQAQSDTALWMQEVMSGRLTAMRGLALSDDDRLRGEIIELGHIIGITHAPDSALSMIGMMTDAVLQGQQAALETGSPESEKQSPLLDENERLPDWAENCSPVRH